MLVCNDYILLYYISKTFVVDYIGSGILSSMKPEHICLQGWWSRCAISFWCWKDKLSHLSLNCAIFLRDDQQLGRRLVYQTFCTQRSPNCSYSPMQLFRLICCLLLSKAGMMDAILSLYGIERYSFYIVYTYMKILFISRNIKSFIFLGQ